MKDHCESLVRCEENDFLKSQSVGINLVAQLVADTTKCCFVSN